MRRQSLLLALSLALAACATAQRPLPAERLYFSLEVRHEGKLVGKPKLVGETGKVLRAERRQPGATVADYQLALRPSAHREGDAFNIEMQIATPEARGQLALDLLHGEERKVELGKHPGDLEVKLVLMRIDSPEFRALMSLSDPERAPPSAI